MYLQEGTHGLGASNEELLAWDLKKSKDAAQVQAYGALAKQTTGQTLKWVMYGAGGLLLIGGLALWAISRKGK